MIKLFILKNNQFVYGRETFLKLFHTLFFPPKCSLANKQQNYSS